jgi:hypothetical protein
LEMKKKHTSLQGDMMINLRKENEYEEKGI